MSDRTLALEQSPKWPIHDVRYSIDPVMKKMILAAGLALFGLGWLGFRHRRSDGRHLDDAAI